MFKCFIFVLLACSMLSAENVSQRDCNREMQELRKEMKTLRKIVHRQGVVLQHVAFDAEMSTSFNHTREETRLIFDTVNTNIGNAYSPSAGIFTVPEEGIYLLSWHIRGNLACSIHTKLMVNGGQIASLHTDCSERRGFKATGTQTIMYTLFKNDIVYIENHSNGSRGNILNDVNGQSGFVGTLLF